MPEHDESGSGRGNAAKAAKADNRAPASFGAFVRKPVDRNAVDRHESAPQPPATGQMRPETVESWPDDAVEIGAIVDAYGLKGQVKVVAHAQAGRGGDALLRAKRWWLVKGEDRRSAAVSQAKAHADTFVAQLSGVTDRDTASAMRGFAVHVQRTDFPTLDIDEYYWVDLLGLEVVNEDGIVLGNVADMMDNGAQSILRVEYMTIGKDGKPVTDERLIPFVGVYVKTVDLAARRIVVDWQADY